mgnify:CR=1 FL=1
MDHSASSLVKTLEARSAWQFWSDGTWLTVIWMSCASQNCMIFAAYLLHQGECVEPWFWMLDRATWLSV